MTDTILALRAYLLADTGVQALSGGRIFNETLPQGEASSMPRAAVVLQSYGGTGYANLNVINPDYVIRTYGANAMEAHGLASAITNALRNINRTVSGNALLHSALLQTGPFYGRDPETYWGYYYSTWTVASDYREVN